MLLYQAALPLSTQTLNFTARLIRARRRVIRSRCRAIDPGQQALLTLAYLHQGHTFEQLAPGFGISRATDARRVNEVIDLLAVHAPRLRDGLRRAKRSGRMVIGMSPEWMRLSNTTAGDDVALALDYRAGLSEPSVVGSDWWTDPTVCAWRPVAPSLPSFAATGLSRSWTLGQACSSCRSERSGGQCELSLVVELFRGG